MNMNLMRAWAPICCCVLFVLSAAAGSATPIDATAPVVFDDPGAGPSDGVPEPPRFTDLEQFRSDYLNMGTLLFELSPAMRHDSGQLEAWRGLVLGMSDEELQLLIDSGTDPEMVRVTLDGLWTFIDALADKPVRTHTITGTLTPEDPVAYSLLCGIIRDNEDVINALRIVYYVAKGVAIVAQGLCDSVVVVLGAGTTVPACIVATVANGTAEVARQVIEQEDKCNDDIAAAEAHAVYENSRTLVGAVQCLPVAGGLLRGHGCDGEDNDCNFVIDDCPEDVFGPEVHIDAAVFGACFKTAAEAAAAVAAAVKATDECGTVTVGAPVVGGVECDVPITVTATDNCGNATVAATMVKIDATPATIVFPPDLDGSCYPSIAVAEAAVMGAADIMDNCSSLEDLSITIHSSVDRCALRVAVMVVDECGNQSSSAVTVRVDTEIPTVDVAELEIGFRGEVLGFQVPVCFDSVANAEAEVLARTQFADNCTPGGDLTASVSSLGDPCSLLVTSRAEDECGNVNTDSVTVRVDPVVPSVSCAVTVTELWPPNHEWIDVGFSFLASDNCPGDPTIVVRVTSDERTAQADGAGRTSPSPDADILRELDGSIEGILLRAERSTSSDGRVYRIRVTATDACGNSSHSDCFVTVSPHGGASAVDSGQFYDATGVN